MRVALTGTPGTGKTTAANRAEIDLEVIHLNEVIRADPGLACGTDPSRESVVADLDALHSRLADRNDVLFESHLAHHLPVDRVVVLRCHPEELRRRLQSRGWGEAKVTENVDSETLDMCLAEAVERHGTDHVYEVDTTDMSRAAVARELEAIVAGERNPGVGRVDFLDP